MFYNKYVTNLVLNLGGQTTKVLDKGSIEFLGPHGLEIGLVKLSKNIASLNTGVVTSYALYILMGVILYLLIAFYLVQFNMDLVLLLLITIFSFMSNYSYKSKDSYTSNNVLQSGVLPMVK